MAYQLSDIRTKVQQRIKDTSYSTSEITNYLNDTINDVFNEYQLPFMETSQDYTVTASVADITNGSGLPSNFNQPIALINTTAGLERTIPFIDYTKLQQQYPDPFDTTRNAANQPQYWTTFTSTIKLFPTPAAAYTLTLLYYKKPTALSADADVPEIPSQFEELLIAGAAYRIFQIKDMYDIAAIWQNKYDELLQKLVVRYSAPQFGEPFIMPVNVNTTRGNF